VKEGKGGNPPVILEKDAYVANEKDKYREYALIIKEHINAKGESEYTDLEIQSQTLQSVLKAIISKRSQPGMFPNPTVFRKPYYALFHCREGIKEYEASEFCTEEKRTHLQYLKEFMLERFEDLETAQKNKVEKGLIDFKNLGILFEAGCLVIGQLTKPVPKGDPAEKMEKTVSPECFVFHHISNELEDKERGGKYVEISVYRWGFNGTKFGLTAHTLRIAEFPGSREITELECYPWKLMPKEKKDKYFRQMVERGRRWCKYMEPTSCVYQGLLKNDARTQPRPYDTNSISQEPLKYLNVPDTDWM
jgi:hypothetical protein